MNETMFVDRVHSFVAVPRAILPSRPLTLRTRRAGGQRWPHLRPPPDHACVGINLKRLVRLKQHRTRYGRSSWKRRSRRRSPTMPFPSRRTQSDPSRTVFQFQVIGLLRVGRNGGGLVGPLRAFVEALALSDRLLGLNVVLWVPCNCSARAASNVMSRYLLNIAKRSLLRLMLSCVGLASKHAAG
jgi:hypothetical protein